MVSQDLRSALRTQRGGRYRRTRCNRLRAAQASCQPGNLRWPVSRTRTFAERPQHRWTAAPAGRSNAAMVLRQRQAHLTCTSERNPS